MPRKRKNPTKHVAKAYCKVVDLEKKQKKHKKELNQFKRQLESALENMGYHKNKFGQWKK